MPRGIQQAEKGSSVFLGLCYTVAGILVVMLTLKVVPIYMENHAVGSVLDSLNQRSAIARSTPFEVKDWILKGFKMNSIRDISSDAVRVRRKGAFLAAEINYERRIGFVGNIDIVISFENSWKIKQQ